MRCVHALLRGASRLATHPRHLPPPHPPGLRALVGTTARRACVHQSSVIHDEHRMSPTGLCHSLWRSLAAREIVKAVYLASTLSEKPYVGVPGGPLTRSVVMPPRLMDALTGVTLDRATVPVAAPVLMYTWRNAPVRRLPSTLHSMAQAHQAAHYGWHPPSRCV